jgi:hypothetical protein
MKRKMKLNDSNAKRTKNLRHREIVDFARSAIRELGAGFGATKAQIFWHILERHPVLTEAVMRGVDEAWQSRGVEHFDIAAGDVILETVAMLRTRDPRKSLRKR